MSMDNARPFVMYVDHLIFCKDVGRPARHSSVHESKRSTMRRTDGNMAKLNPNSSYVSSIDGLTRGLGVTTKGRGPLIPLVRSTGGVLANNGDRIGLNLVNPGGGEAGDFGMSGTEGTVGMCEEVGWRPRESLRLGTEGTSNLESSCRPC